MTNKRALMCFGICLLLAVGCSSHQNLAENRSDMTREKPKITRPRPSPVLPEKPEPSKAVRMQDEAGYQLKPVSIEIEKGKPYVPVGAEVVTRDGKVPLTEIIKRMAVLKGFSVSWADDVKQDQLVDVDIRPEENFWAALENILRQLDYFYETRDNTIIVGYKETRKYFLSMPVLTEKWESSIGGNMLPRTGGGTGESSGVKAKVDFKVDAPEYSFWDSLAEALGQVVTCEGCPAPVIDRSLGMVTVSAPRRIHNDVERYLTTLEEEAHKQVVIEAKILEVILSEDSKRGIDWSGVLLDKNISGQISFGEKSEGVIYSTRDIPVGNIIRDVTAAPINWNLVVSFFDQFGDARIISNPRVSLLNGHGAVLSAGEVIVYLSGCNVTTTEAGALNAEPETDSVTSGLTIGVKANILDDDQVVLYVFPALTRLRTLKEIGESECGPIQAPETFVRQIATFAKVKNNEILIIGGLIQKEETENENKVPYLGDFPLVGRLFREDTKTTATSELVIILTTRVIQPDTHLVVEKKIEPLERSSFSELKAAR